MLETLLPDNAIPDTLLAELRDGLRRKQRELPARLLAHVEPGLLARTCLTPGICQAGVERALVAAALPTLGLLDGAPLPALVVEHAPRCTDTGDPILAHIAAAGSAASVVLVDREARLAARRRDHLVAAGHDAPGFARTDPTMALPLPRAAARPRLHLLPGNVLGTLGTLGAIRMLRVLRATMEPADRLLVCVDVRRDGAAVEAAFAASSALATAMLDLLDASNRELGTDFPLDAFVHSAHWDGEFSRVETVLVATRAVKVHVPGAPVLSMRKGQTIRTGVHATFDRRRLTAMLDSVALAIDDWAADAGERVALAMARAAR